VEEKLKSAGFGIVSEIDMKQKFKQKLDVDFRPYLILGACSPKHAYAAVNCERHIGLMLPCNVVLQSVKKEITEVSVIDPYVAMQPVNNSEVEPIAKEIQGKLKTFIDSM
jgi:uncharacterized protein (DUF302 family)